MVIARNVLALHDGIREVFVLEHRPGQYVVVEEAAKDGSILSESLHETRKHTQMVPAVILGAAGQFTGQPELLKLVGILYQKWGVIFTHLDEKKLLALSTSPESLYSVMEKLKDALPKLLEQESSGKAFAVKSAAEAEDIARSYLVGRLHGSIFVDEISYREANYRWIVLGCNRRSRWAYSKRFQVEMDAKTGSVMRFISIPTVRRQGVYIFFAELACLLAILLAVLAWLLQHGLWR